MSERAHRRKLEIESAANATFKRLKSLLSSKGIKKENECILSGQKLVIERLRDPRGLPLSILRPRGGSGERFEFQIPEGLDISEIELADNLFEELDELGTHAALLLIKTPDIPDRALDSAPVGLELVCPVGDPQNLGAIARSARAFGVERLCLTSEAASPFLPKSLKASAGSVLDLNLARLPDLATCLQQWLASPLKNQVYALDLTGEPLRSAKLPKDLFLICGEEGPGVPTMAGLQKVMIPTSGVESLNAAVATAIAIYETLGRRLS